MDLGAEAEVARAIQKSAAAAHATQSEALPEMISRLDQLGSMETLRWLGGARACGCPGSGIMPV